MQPYTNVINIAEATQTSGGKKKKQNNSVIYDMAGTVVQARLFLSSFNFKILASNPARAFLHDLPI